MCDWPGLTAHTQVNDIDKVFWTSGGEIIPITVVLIGRDSASMNTAIAHDVYFFHKLLLAPSCDLNGLSPLPLPREPWLLSSMSCFTRYSDERRLVWFKRIVSWQILSFSSRMASTFAPFPRGILGSDNVHLSPGANTTSSVMGETLAPIFIGVIPSAASVKNLTSSIGSLVLTAARRPGFTD